VEKGQCERRAASEEMVSTTRGESDLRRHSAEGGLTGVGGEGSVLTVVHERIACWAHSTFESSRRLFDHVS
jgi:hypothetical protein